MSAGVSQSRFYMWRAIFAIAHADGKIDKKEEGFMDSYLQSEPFTLQQKAILEDDIIHPKDPGEMLAQVSSYEDQGLFFQFARMLVWSDGNYDLQEKEIMERLLGAHMEKLDVESLTGALNDSRQKAEAFRAEQQTFEGGRKKGGIGPLVARLFTLNRGRKAAGEVSESRFYMWRAIFAMAHADHEVSPKEQGFMRNVLDTENFDRQQRVILERDIETPQDPTDMFMQIAEQEDRSRFFYYARMLCWCDGSFDEQEQEIMLRLKSLHVRNVDFERMMGALDMELADEHKDMLAQDMSIEGHALRKFMRRFSK